MQSAPPSGRKPDLVRYYAGGSLVQVCRHHIGIVEFTPVLAQYRFVKGDEDEIDDLKDDLCLKPQVLNALKSRLKGGGGWKVTDISLSTDAPAHWIDSPNPTLSVQKPGDATVVFCGVDDKTANKPIVLGVTPDDAESIRVLMFEPAAK